MTRKGVPNRRSSAFIRVHIFNQIAMTLDELKQRLYDAGCSPNNYHIGEPEGASDVYCLAKRDGRFHLFYTERGLDSPPEQIFDDEAEACQYYYDFVMNIRHNHLVGFYQSLDSLQRHASFSRKARHRHQFGQNSLRRLARPALPPLC